MIKASREKDVSDNLSRQKSIYGATMKYKNSEMKIDELVGYFRDGKISLIPPFQRGSVWSPTLRRKLIENMVRGRPIPAIFLYKEAAGSKYSYNILDGKQRLESLLLFIGGRRGDLSIPDWSDYFHGRPKSDKLRGNFKINIASDGERAKRVAFADLDEQLVREFREYAIPTIEIDLDAEDSSLSEIINLFIDINQLGVKVSRFDIVRTMTASNKLLKGVFDLIAIKQARKKDNFYMMKKSDYTFVLKRLKTVQSLEGRQQQVDRMWERLLEIVLFLRTHQHRPPTQLLKAFISNRVDSTQISNDEMNRLRPLFSFLKALYSQGEVATSRLATDQIHFYTMATTLVEEKLIETYDNDTLASKLAALASIIEGKKSPPKEQKNVYKDYMGLASKQTTNPGNRSARQEKFAALVHAL